MKQALGTISVVLTCTALAIAGNDLAVLTDEFADSATLTEWSRVHETEQWFADQLEVYDIDTTRRGRLVMMPYTVTWYQDWRGPLSYKEVTGDFVITTQVEVTGRDGVSIPQAQFSLAGLMMRTPRAITPATWTAGGENYVFFSLGQGNNGGATYQYEHKTTTNSNSVLTLTPAPGPTVILQLARLGEYVILLRREPGQPWVVHHRFHRADLPATLQVGLVAYTDWRKVEIFTPFVHNSTTLVPPLPPGVVDPNPFIPFAPDLIVGFDYARFFRPVLPPELIGVDLTNSVLAPDAELLEFLGEQADVGVPIPTVSQWGAVVLILLLIIAGTLAFARRSAPAARVYGDLR